MSNLKGEVVREYLNKFPDTPSLTLAKLIYKENNKLFKNIESVRTTLRYYRGSSGVISRKRIENRYNYTNPTETDPFILTSNIPCGKKAYDDWSPFNIHGKSILVLADAHIPYHDKDALKIALDYGQDKNIDTILFLGDLMDFFTVSFWDKDPRRRNIQEEVDIARAIIGIIKSAYPQAKMVYKVGNHGERLERYLRIKAPELLGYEALEYGAIIKAKENNIDIVKDRRIIKVGKLSCIHGHEFGKMLFSPVNPARGLYLRGKTLSICGHNHQTPQHTEKDMNDVITSCWSIGCLCDLRPEFMPINKWNHGFAHIQVDKNGFNVNNKKIIKGKVH